MYCGEKPFHHIKCSHSPMKPPLAMLTYSLFFCKRKLSISNEGATPSVPSRHTGFTHLQEMCQHHVHIHVLLLSPTSHEAQVLSAGNGAWLQRLLLCLQERLHRESKFGWVLEHLCRRKERIPTTSFKSCGLGCVFKFASWVETSGHGSSFRTDRICRFLSHQVRVQMEGRGQMPRIVLLCRPTIHHEKSDAVLKSEITFFNDALLLEQQSSAGWVFDY